MRVAVIRSDLSAPIFLADLEPVSKRDASIDPPGQERYITYPTTSRLEAVLASPSTGSGAVVVSGTITLSLVVTASNNTLTFKMSSTAAEDSYTVASGTYATIGALQVAVAAALATQKKIQVRVGTGNTLVFESLTYGVNSYLQVTATGNGTTAFGLSATTRTVPTAAQFLTAAGFGTSTINVATATLNAVGTTTATNALANVPSPRGAAAVANFLAPQFAETPVANQSFLRGSLRGFASAAFNPNARKAGVVAGAAITVLEDDGSTAYGIANTVPTITTATLSAGNLTISGKTLGGECGGDKDRNRVTVVQVTKGTTKIVLDQRRIEKAGGSVGETSIYIPASLLPSVVAGNTVKVQFMQLQSGSATIS